MSLAVVSQSAFPLLVASCRSCHAPGSTSSANAASYGSATQANALCCASPDRFALSRERDRGAAAAQASHGARGSTRDEIRETAWSNDARDSGGDASDGEAPRPGGTSRRVRASPRRSRGEEISLGGRAGGRAEEGREAGAEVAEGNEPRARRRQGERRQLTSGARPRGKGKRGGRGGGKDGRAPDAAEWTEGETTSAGESGWRAGEDRRDDRTWSDDKGRWGGGMRGSAGRAESGRSDGSGRGRGSNGGRRGRGSSRRQADRSAGVGSHMDSERLWVPPNPRNYESRSGGIRAGSRRRAVGRGRPRNEGGWFAADGSPYIPDDPAFTAASDSDSESDGDNGVGAAAAGAAAAVPHAAARSSMREEWWAGPDGTSSWRAREAGEACAQSMRAPSSSAEPAGEAGLAGTDGGRAWGGWAEAERTQEGRDSGAEGDGRGRRGERAERGEGRGEKTVLQVALLLRQQRDARGRIAVLRAAEAASFGSTRVMWLSLLSHVAARSPWARTKEVFQFVKGRVWFRPHPMWYAKMIALLTKTCLRQLQRRQADAGQGGGGQNSRVLPGSVWVRDGRGQRRGTGGEEWERGGVVGMVSGVRNGEFPQEDRDEGGEEEEQQAVGRRRRGEEDGRTGGRVRGGGARGGGDGEGGGAGRAGAGGVAAVVVPVWQLVEEMQRVGVPPSASVCNSLLKALCAAALLPAPPRAAAAAAATSCDDGSYGDGGTAERGGDLKGRVGKPERGAEDSRGVGTGEDEGRRGRRGESKRREKGVEGNEMLLDAAMRLLACMVAVQRREQQMQEEERRAAAGTAHSSSSRRAVRVEFRFPLTGYEKVTRGRGGGAVRGGEQGRGGEEEVRVVVGEGCGPTVVSYNIVLDALGQSGRLAGMEQLWHQMTLLGIARTHVGALGGGVAGGCEALRLERVSGDGKKRGFREWGGRLEGIQWGRMREQRERIEGAKEGASHITSPHLTSPHLTSPHLTSPHLTSPTPLSPLRPPQATYLAAMAAYARHRSASRLLSIHRQMAADDSLPSPTRATLSVLIECLGAVGAVGRMEGAFEAMQERGWVVSTVTWNSALAAYAARNDMVRGRGEREEGRMGEGTGVDAWQLSRESLLCDKDVRKASKEVTFESTQKSSQKSPPYNGTGCAEGV
ncbi:unnamed protein product [Closterium sp. NIES-53]